MCARLDRDNYAAASVRPRPDESERLRVLVAELHAALRCPVALCALSDSGDLSRAFVLPETHGDGAALQIILPPEVLDAIMYSKASELGDDFAEVLDCAQAIAIPLMREGGRWIALAMLDEVADQKTLALLSLLGCEASAALAYERARSEAGVMEELNSRLKAVVETIGASSREAIVAVDLDGRVMEWNAAAERLFGWRAEEVLGEILPFAPEDRRDLALRVIRKVAAKGGREIRHPIATMVCKDGSPIPTVSTSFPLVDRHRVTFGVVSVVELVKDALEVPETVSRYRLLFDRGLLGPVTAIKGYVELLTRPEVLENGEYRNRVIKTLSEHASYLTRVLDQLLTIARLEAEDTAPTRTEVDMSVLLSVAAANLSLAEPHHEIAVDVDPDIPSASLDTELMRVAIDGLITHSLRRCVSGGRIVLSAEFDGEAGHCIHVTDDGPDLTHADGAETFRRPDTASRHDTAFGPYLAALAARVHGGDASASRGPEGGGRFTLHLPTERA